MNTTHAVTATVPGHDAAAAPDRGARLIRLAGVEAIVPDPAATAGWLHEALDFVVDRQDDGSYTVTVGGEYAMPVPDAALRLVRGTAPGCAVGRITVEAGPRHDLDRLAARLTATGATTVALDADHDGGAGLEVTGEGIPAVAIRRGVAARTEPLTPSPLRPRRLGHVNLQVSDPAGFATVLTDGLGMLVSERIGDRFHFLRFGTEHHNVGIRKGPGPTAHHIAFEVPGWDSYRVICDHLAGLGHTIEYGPGRHGPGRNMFVYVRDPFSGLRLELFTDMAHIPDEDAYTPPRWSVEDRPRTVNQWGPAPPESFLATESFTEAAP
ncbi:VOC family protein [Streptomyces puniciscabiei]